MSGKAEPPVPPTVVMGVSGVGKTFIGSQLAVRLGVPFIDADDLHPVANKEKMAAGHPLDDSDRWPWLQTVGTELARGGVVACSALKRSYRDELRRFAPDAFFVQLEAPVSVIADRLDHRRHEYMPPGLLNSQLATLEPLAADEAGTIVDTGRPADEIVSAAADAVATVAR